MTSNLDVRLLASFALAIAFNISMPVALVLWVRRRLGVDWKVIGVGALAFALSQLLTRVPAVQFIQYLMRDELKNSAVLLQVWWVVLAVTAGLFEETARLIAFKRPLANFRTWRDAIGFGAGHGGLESMLFVGGASILGLINIVVLSRMDLSHLSLGPEQLEQVRTAKAQIAALRWWEPLLGAYERICAMLLHLALSVLVLQRFLRNERRWYGYAVGLHSLVGWVSLMVARQVGVVASEGVLTVFALFSLWLVFRLRPVRSQP